MDFDELTAINLDRLERLFRLSIQTGYAPFLGLQKSLFEPAIRKTVREKLLQSRDPLAAYLACLAKWPAVFLSYLTIYVAEGFGEHGTFEVYPFIEKALTLHGFSLQQKDKLWKTYRNHCVNLGLSVSSRRSGANFMVDEYLRQAGVPLKYVPELTDKMLRYANGVGLPDEDDPSAIRLWQQGLCERLTMPFPRTVRKAVEADDTSYYVLLFLKLLEQPANESGAEDFETLMSRAIHGQEERARRISQQKGQGIGIPQVVWRDQQLGVELPPGESHSWRITTGNAAAEFHGTLESRFVPFDQELPAEVQIDHGHGRVSRKFPLWEDGRNNRLLIFSSEGTLVEGTRLGAEKSVTLEPGNYQLVSRFIPDGMDGNAEELRNDPALYALTIFLEPGQQLKLTRGPASVTFIADSKPLLVWEGESVRGVRGHEIFCSTGTHLKVMIPSELMLGGEAKYLVRLNPGSLGESLEIPVESSVEGHLNIDIAAVCRQWKPGVTRLLAEIQRRDVQRASFRSAIYLWNGLQRVENRTRFFCAKLPGNLDYGESDNLLVNNEKSFLTYRNDDNRFFRMVFGLGDNKRLTFTSVVPGVFMQLKDYAESHLTERSLKKGSTLSFAWNSRSLLEIFSTTNGILRLGEFQKKIDFSTCGCKRLPLSGLVEYLGPMADTLQLVDEETGYAEDLLRLVAPHEVLNFSMTKKSNQHRILFALAQEASAVSMTATDALSGRTESLLLGCNRAFERGASGVNGWLTCECDGESGLHKHELRIMLDGWPNGAWVLDLDANINGRWGGFSNARGDVYSSGFVIVDGTLCSSPSCFFADLATLELADKLEILQRIHEKLLCCYALESWNELRWLESLWQTLLEEFDKKEEFAPQLIALAEETAPEGASCSWVPMLSVSSRYPWLYALPARCYQGISPKSNSLFVKCLTTMSSIKYGLLTMIKESVLHQIFAFGFANAHLIEQGKEPHQFNMQRYELALKMQDLTERLRLLREDDWQPGEGDYLGALHYLYAMEKLKQFYLDTLPGNDYRRGKALYLCRTLHHYPLDGLPTHLGNGMSYLHFLTNAPEEEFSVDEENVLLISQFLSLLARVCRWETRGRGSLEQFLAKARQIVADNSQFESILGYLLYIGRDVFGFYLLLWEAILTADYNIGEIRNYVRK